MGALIVTHLTHLTHFSYRVTHYRQQALQIKSFETNLNCIAALKIIISMVFIIRKFFTQIVGTYAIEVIEGKNL
jgi:hypothetical protein